MKRYPINKKILLTLGGVFFFFCQSYSQTVAVADSTAETKPIHIPEFLFNPNFYVLALTAAILIASILTLCYTIIKLSKRISGESEIIVEPAAEIAKVSKETAWHKLMRKLTRSVPVAQEADVMLDHNYDGIRELDNPLPPWWKYGFYVTIVIAVIYIFHYHIAKTGKLQLAEYNDEMQLADQEKAERMKNTANNINEENVIRLTDVSSISEGSNIYKTNCITCHGDKGQGIVGPNLTDDYWLHGGSIKDIFKTINLGVPGKAMVSWKEKLSPKQIQQVASFVMSLKGTNPPGALPPAGDKYVEENTDNNSKAVKDTTAKEIKK